MRIVLNGEAREVNQGTGVQELLAELKLRADQVAVEINRHLVRTNAYDQALNEGDEVEIVTFVGGG